MFSMKTTINQLPNDVFQLKQYIISMEASFVKIQEEKTRLQEEKNEIRKTKEQLEQEKLKAESELSALKLKYDDLFEQFKLSKQRQFGRSSEKNLLQLSFFIARIRGSPGRDL